MRVLRSSLVLALVVSSIGACATRGERHGARSAPISASASASASTQSVDDLDPMLEPLRASAELPGLAAAVLDDRRLLAIGAVGRRKLDDATPVGRADAWHLGSETKAMTATLAAMLVEDGAIAWDTTLVKVFPEWSDGIDPALREVTIRMLLAHRAGLPKEMAKEAMAELWSAPLSGATRKAAVRALLSHPPATKPGTTFEYANADYVIVGAALERVTGRSWESLLEERIFSRLGMASCGFGPPATEGHVDAPWGHERGLVGLRAVAPGPQADNPRGLGPAGTVHCNVADWGKFLQVHLRGARCLPTIVSPSSVVALQTPWPGGDYAFGWRTAEREWAGGKTLAHAGSNGMFYATAWIAPAKDRVLVAVTNAGDDRARDGVERAIQTLIARYVAP